MHLLGLIGKKGTGKSTVAKAVELCTAHCARYSFAGNVKSDCSKMIGVSVEKMEEEKDTFRGLFQWYGQYKRDKEGYDYWIRRLMTKMSNDINSLPRDTIIVVDDVRFLNEAQHLLAIGAKLWHITRPALPSDDKHISETEQDKFLSHGIIPAHTIINDNTREVLINYIKNIVAQDYPDCYVHTTKSC